MLAQNNLMDTVSTSACSSLSTHSNSISSAKDEEMDRIKVESPVSQADYDNGSPKSADVLANGQQVDYSPMATSMATFPAANNSPNSAAPVTAGGETTLGLSSALQALSASEAAAAIVSLTASRAGQPANIFAPHAPPVDINAVFGKYFGEPTPISVYERPARGSASPEALPPIGTTALDTAAFLQLSQLLAAQQQQQQLGNVGRSPDQEPKGDNEQRAPRGSAAGQRHDSASSNCGANDRRKSYPYTFQYCVLCQKNVHSSKLPCHIRQCHVGKPMFQCPACDFTSTYSKNNVKSHMVSLHGLAGDPINYMDQYAGQVEEFMKKCFPNVRGRGRPVHGRLSPSHQQHQHQHQQQTARNATAASLERRNSSPFGVAQINNMRLKSASSSLEISDHELNNNSNGRQHHQPNNNRAPHRQNPHDLSQLAVPQTMANGSAGGANAALIAQQTARFNEIYAMAMFGGKASLAEKFSPLLNNNKNEFPLQNLNPLLYLQQLSQLNAASQNSNMFERNGVKMEVDSEKTLSDEYVNDGMEKILNNIQKTLKHNNNAHHSGAPQQKCGTKRARPLDDYRAQTPPLLVQKKSREDDAKYLQYAVMSCGSEFNEPRYLPQSLKWVVIESEQLENTVFRNFSNSSDLIEKLDLAPFETLLNNNNALLTESQAESIRAVREKIGLKSFEIMFAVHRLDLRVLNPENVRLVLSIAPVDVDIRRFAAYEQHNSVSVLNEDEQFILQLSKIDRLKEKLLAMDFMGSFADRLAKINKDVSDVIAAVKILENSTEFHTILHLLLVYGNLISGDFNAQLVEGFRPSRILDMCEFSFGNDFSAATDDTFKKQKPTKLMDVLAEHITKSSMHLSVFCEQCQVVENAANVNLQSVSEQLQHFGTGLQLLEFESLTSAPNQILSDFISHCESEITQAYEIMRTVKQQLAEMLQFFGEVPMASGDVYGSVSTFLVTITEFSKRLGAAILRVSANTSSSPPRTHNNSLIHAYT